MSRLRSVIVQYFGDDALEWFDRSYLTDWAIVGGLWFLTGLVHVSPVFEREFTITDEDISYPHKKNQVGGFLNNAVALFAPLTVVAVLGAVRRSLFVVHHGAIGILATRGISELITEFLKHNVGRLRPDFLARCKWDKIIEKCTGKAQSIVDGRQSFPSGHSSTAFSGMVFLSLLIAGQTAAWCFSIPKSPRSFRSSRMAAILLTLLPVTWATHVALTRIQDYRHHKEDVIVGSLIGILSASLCYLIFWPNPFSSSTFDCQVHGQPRLLYTHKEQAYTSSRATDFELSRLEEDLDVV